MANFSTYLEEELLDHVLKNNAYTSPAAVYAGLVSDVAADADMEAGTLTNEITAYTGNRPAITWGAISQSGGKSTVSTATAALEFVNMPAVTTKYVIICDGATKSAGNVLVWAALTTARTTVAGDTLRIPIGDLTVDLD
jgi:hypothetical protein